ncbi:unnamed protein product [Symbiodinium sp. CCMP2456]|nr:unnamed protein product [Symbiodinium sp. CCMP2456]
MGIKIGQSGFVRLDSKFGTPCWRQGLVVQKADKGHWRIIVPVAQEASRSSAAAALLLGRRFIFVEVGADQFLRRCNKSSLEIDVDSKLLLEAAIEHLDKNADLVFATASEDVPPLAKQQEESVDGSSSEDGEDSDASSNLGELVRDMKKAWQSRGTGDESEPDRSEPMTVNPLKQPHRFKMLRRKRSGGKDKRQQEEAWSQAAAAAMGQGKDPLQALATLQLLKLTAKERHKGKKGSNRSLSSSSSTASSSSSEGNRRRRDPSLKGAARAIGNYRRLGKSMKAHPLRHIKRYIKNVEEDLGVDADQPYRLTDHGRKINWGKQKGLQRTYYMLGAILDLILKGKYERAGLQVVQCLRAVHQAAINQGSWDVAWLLTNLPDPLARRRFGGEEEGLETIAAYVKSVQELEKRTRDFRGLRDTPGDNNDEHDEEAKPPKGRGRGQGQK